MTFSAWVALITLLPAVPAGYALARLRLPGAKNMGIAIFMSYLVPAIILFLPLSRVVATLGLQDSWWALVVVYPTFTIPFCTCLMMGFFKTVPMEMEEAARDGAPRSSGWLLGLGLLHRIRAAGIADMEHQELHGLVRRVRVVVPPSSVVHE